MMDGDRVHGDEYAAELLADERGELNDAESSALAAHLETCPSCRKERAGIRKLEGILARVPQVEPSPATWTGLLERIREEAPPAGRANPAPGDTTGNPRSGNRPRPRNGGVILVLGSALTAAAASLLLLLLPTSSPSRIEDVAGRLVVRDRPVGVGEAFDLIPGSVLTAAGMCRFTLRGEREAVITAAAGTRMKALAPTGSPGRDSMPGCLMLTEGRTLVDVRPGEGAFVLRIPDGAIEVTGTMFDVRVDAAVTVLTVIRGEVLLRTGDTPVRLIPEESVTVPRGGAPSPKRPADPWRARRWCTSPTPRLDLSSAPYRFDLLNETYQALPIRPFRPDAALYSLEIEGPGGTFDLRIQAALLAGGTTRPVRETSDTEILTLEPGKSYGIQIDAERLRHDLKKRFGAGTYRLSAVYKPYGPSSEGRSAEGGNATDGSAGDWPDGARDGVLESAPRELRVD